jgi:hypothetical protein
MDATGGLKLYLHLVASIDRSAQVDTICHGRRHHSRLLAGARGGRSPLRLRGHGVGAVRVQRARDVPPVQPGAERMGPQPRQRLLRHVGREQAAVVAAEVWLDRLLWALGAKGPGRVRQVHPGNSS